MEVDGRFATERGLSVRDRSLGQPSRSGQVSNAEQDEGIQETELANALDLDDGDEDSEGDSLDGEMVLLKDEFDLLQAFHRLVPLPALRSKILRVVCDDDLQVAEEERAEIEATTPTPKTRVHTVEPEFNPIPRGGSLSAVTLVKHSPLTRRLSTKASTKNVGASGLTKPHREINLAVQTPRLKKLTDRISGDDRIG